MPHYVKKLWEKFLLPSTIIIWRNSFVGIQNFEAINSKGADLIEQEYCDSSALAIDASG